MAEMTYIVTYIDVQPGFTNLAIASLTGYRQATAAEEGNSGIRVLQEASRRNRFVIVESWRDESAFQLHEGAPHTGHFRSSLRNIHNSPYDQRVHHAFAVAQQPREAGPD